MEVGAASAAWVDHKILCAPIPADGGCLQFFEFRVQLATDEQAGFGRQRFEGGDSGAVDGYYVKAYRGVWVCGSVYVGENCVAEFLWNGEEGSWVLLDRFGGFWWISWQI